MNERSKTILVGVAVGALFGALLGWLASANVDYDDGELHGVSKLKPTDYLALGMSMLTFARQFGNLLS